MIAIEDIDWNDRFWSKVDQRGPEDCWEWRGARRSKAGYGGFQVGNRLVSSHRHAYELCVGEITSDKPFVCHRCNNPPCVNPKHLYAGSQKDNLQQMACEGRSASGDNHGSRIHPESLQRGDAHYARTNPELLIRGERHWNVKVLDIDIPRIFKMRTDGMTLKEIALHFNVGFTQIHNILIGKSRKLCIK